MGSLKKRSRDDTAGMMDRLHLPVAGTAEVSEFHAKRAYSRIIGSFYSQAVEELFVRHVGPDCDRQL